jgi:tetratricopeptide (TPR) repeat protein
LNLKPSPQMYLLVGSIYSRQGRLRNAIKYIKKAIEMDPCCDEAFYQLGLAFLGQNWRKKARECFQTALQLNPKNSRHKDALDLLERNLAKSPSTELNLDTILNEESMEFLVKDELRLNFRQREPDLRPIRKDAEGK